MPWTDDLINGATAGATFGGSLLLPGGGPSHGSSPENIGAGFKGVLGTLSGQNPNTNTSPTVNPDVAGLGPQGDGSPSITDAQLDALVAAGILPQAAADAQKAQNAVAAAKAAANPFNATNAYGLGTSWQGIGGALAKNPTLGGTAATAATVDSGGNGAGAASAGQTALWQSLADEAAGKGNPADDAYLKAGADKNLATTLSVLGSQRGGGLNAALAGREAVDQNAASGAQLNQALGLQHAGLIAGAQGAEAGILGQQSQTASGYNALNAGYQQATNLANSNLSLNNSQLQAGNNLSLLGLQTGIGTGNQNAAIGIAGTNAGLQESTNALNTGTANANAANTANFYNNLTNAGGKAATAASDENVKAGIRGANPMLDSFLRHYSEAGGDDDFGHAARGASGVIEDTADARLLSDKKTKEDISSASYEKGLRDALSRSPGAASVGAEAGAIGPTLLRPGYVDAVRRIVSDAAPPAPAATASYQPPPGWYVPGGPQQADAVSSYRPPPGWATPPMPPPPAPQPIPIGPPPAPQSQLASLLSQPSGGPVALSDEERKGDISGDLQGKDLEKFLDELHAYNYRYKDPTQPGAAPGRHTGVMAQDLEKSPLGQEFVEDTPHGKQVNYGQMAGVQLAASAYLNDRLDEHERMIKSMSKGKGRKAAHAD